MVDYVVLVVRLRIGRGPVGRAGRFALLFGLVLLITAHLSGGVHGAAFAGPHTVVGAAACSGAGSETGPATVGGEHRPGHEHHADSHFDHTVDRPRADSGEVANPPLLDSGTTQPASATSEFSLACRGGPRSAALCTPGGHAALSLHCVWRQ
ncbi:MAG: hypothetical protein WCD21_03265 [Streptomyces sp.]